jgi:hypothetical protein
VGEVLVGHLATGNVKEGWWTLRGLYRTVEDKAAKPCHDSLEKQTVEREELYDHVPPPGDKIPSHLWK